MKQWIVKYWNQVTHIGVHPEMDRGEQMRLLAINAFLCIAIISTVIYTLAFAAFGSHSALEGLAIVPLALLVFVLNAKSKTAAARVLVIYGLSVVVLLLALSDRRTGTEYIIVAVGCCSAIVFARPLAVVSSFLFSVACYNFYIWYDQHHPFIPDPSIPYTLVQSSLMFLSGFAILTQSMVFRSLVHQYANTLQHANDEIQHMNEELKTSNDQLFSLSSSLDNLVKQKSAELQAYLDTINVNLFAATADTEGVILNVNEQVVNITGYTERELIGQHFSIFDPGEAQHNIYQNLNDIILSGESWRGEVKEKAKDGSYFWLDMVIMPVKLQSTEVAYFVCLALPITDRKMADAYREKSIELFEALAHETSHRVRGPMARVLGMINLIDKQFVTAEEFEWILDKIRENILELDTATSKLTAIASNHPMRRGRPG